MTTPKEDPDVLALRAKPRPVTRLSRRALAVLVGGVSLLVLGGTLYALRPPERASKRPEQLYSTDRKPAAEGLAALPGDYVGVTPAPPVLGPPLPGDLGPAILDAQAEGRIAPSEPGAGPSAAEAAREQRRKARETAIASPLIAVAKRTDVLAEPAAPLTPAVGQPAATPEPTRREAFLAAPADDQTTSVHRLRAAAPNTVMAGTTISAALVTGLNSDLPGQVIATVTAPVFDTVTGRTMLIPQGSRLLGTYDSEVGFGEGRVLVVWTRLILPDGQSIVLDRMPAADGAGFAGIADKVDHHWGRLAAGAALSTLLGVGAELAAPEASGAGDRVIIAGRDSLQDSVNQVGQEITRRNLGVKPTITVRPGYPVRVLVSRDLVLRPYADPPS
jgi:type IV secretion system protein VirB10